MSHCHNSPSEPQILTPTHIVTPVITVWCLRCVLWPPAPADGGNMLSIIPDTRRGEGRGREWEKYFSCVVTTLFHDLQWDYIMRGSMRRMIYRPSQEWEENSEFTAAEMIVMVEERAGDKCNNVNDKIPRELWPGPEPKAAEINWRHHGVPGDAGYIYISKHSIFNPFSIIHQIKELKC